MIRAVDIVLVHPRPIAQCDARVKEEPPSVDRIGTIAGTIEEKAPFAANRAFGRKWATWGVWLSHFIHWEKSTSAAAASASRIICRRSLPSKVMLRAMLEAMSW